MHPVDVEPSDSAKMICASEAERDVTANLGVKPTQVTAPTWVADVYSCNYVYPNGVIALSVKELADGAATTAYFNSLARRLGRRPGAVGLGQGAFRTNDGSVVVRKDTKVLVVDISGLPALFGAPPESRSDVAGYVAKLVLKCWTGA